MLVLDVAIILLLIAINGVLAMSELAVVSSRSHRLEQRSAGGDRGARTAIELSREPTRFLSTIQIGITLVAILAGAFGGAALGGHLSPVLEDVGLEPDTAHGVAVAIAVVAITYLSLVFGEIVPKRVALHSPEGIASFVARPLNMLAVVSGPAVTLLSASTSLVLRLLGLHRNRDDGITEEEVRLLVSRSAEAGSFEREEAELIDRVFHFGDRQVHEVMVPRNRAVGVERSSSISDFYAVYLQTPHSRFPVFDESPDKVVGVLGIKDVLGALARAEVSAADPIEPLVRPALFTPESKPIDDLFREMQATGNQMAVAVDEFGGTAGIATLEQLLEEMVGQVRDELATAQHEITRVDMDTTEVQGALSIEEARAELGLDIPEGSYDTVAGYVLSILGHIPQVGEAIELDGHRITVAEMENVRIEQLRVTRAAGSRRTA